MLDLNREIVFAAAAALGILIVLARAFARRAVPKKIPGDRQALTHYLKENTDRVRQAKLAGRGSSWTRSVGRAICQAGLETASLSVDQKFAALFLVNYHFHRGFPGAAEKKNFIQRTIVVHHRHEISLKSIGSGKYPDTYELTRGPWSSHVPRHVVEGGVLDRPGKTSAKAAFRGVTGRNARSRR